MFEVIKDIWSFAVNKKKFWLLPLLVLMLVLGALLVISQGSAIAPLIYTVF